MGNPFVLHPGFPSPLFLETVQFSSVSNTNFVFLMLLYCLIQIYTLRVILTCLLICKCLEISAKAEIVTRLGLLVAFLYLSIFRL